MPDYYDTETQLNEYLVFHYGEDAQVLGWDFGPVKALGFHKRLVGWIDTDRLQSGSRGLDLGCAVGRIAFELSRLCDSVVGIDASKSFITCADSIKAGGLAAFRLTREGKLGTPVEVQLPADLVRDRVTFSQGDAENLPASLGKFDVVILANLLDRLPHPRKLLQKLPEITRSGAQVVICSPFTWWDDFTHADERLGGFMRDGKEVTSMDTITELLSDDFFPPVIGDEPFLIRQHERKFFMSVAQVGVWTRK
jgi:putative 4-mercaptohistidine N1-methyltranferase